MTKNKNQEHSWGTKSNSGQHILDSKGYKEGKQDIFPFSLVSGQKKLVPINRLHVILLLFFQCVSHWLLQAPLVIFFLSLLIGNPTLILLEKVMFLDKILLLLIHLQKSVALGTTLASEIEPRTLRTWGMFLQAWCRNQPSFFLSE